MSRINNTVRFENIDPLDMENLSHKFRSERISLNLGMIRLYKEYRKFINYIGTS